MSTFILRFLCCCRADGEEDSDSDNSFLRPLLDRDSPGPAMGRNRTYGTKKSTISSSTSAIFGRSPLFDITDAVSNLNIADNQNEDDNDDLVHQGTKNYLDAVDGTKNSPPQPPEVPDDPEDEIPANSSAASINASALNYLKPLTNSYRKDLQSPLQIQRWEAILDDESTISKIAEASFAEVYRVVNDQGSSILKIIQLKIPSDLSSLDSSTAIKVEATVSEVRIMSAMTEVPGFVKFKEAYLVQGKPTKALTKSYEDYINPKRHSTFPHPDKYNEDSTFLVLELGDAGCVLDEMTFEGIEQVWDILLSTIMALGRAEESFQFEHRDLHENNICIISRANRSKSHQNNDAPLRFGFSGLEITLIDYGLSRMNLPCGEEVYYDLEDSLDIFRGTNGHTQYDIYRRMRCHLFTGDRIHYKREWHTEASRSQNNGHTWKEFAPYNNVLWIKYILGFLIKRFKASGPKTEEARKDLQGFEAETKELKTKLSVQTSVSKGGFSTAGEVLQYVVQKGWVSEEQVMGYGGEYSMLSQ